MVIGESLWRSRFASDPSIVGRPLTLSSKPYTVVGVAPQTVTAAIGEAHAWVPMGFDEKEASLYGSHYLRAWGRLRDGVTLDTARADLDRIATNLEQAFPGSNKGWRVVAVPLQEALVGTTSDSLVLLSGAVGLVLLIVCANVASLMLTRGYVLCSMFCVLRS